MSDLRRTGRKFEKREDFDVEKLLENSLGIYKVDLDRAFAKAMPPLSLSGASSRGHAASGATLHK